MICYRDECGVRRSCDGTQHYIQYPWQTDMERIPNGKCYGWPDSPSHQDAMYAARVGRLVEVRS